MKEYILKFRSQVFEGTFSLFKRILVPTIILNIIVTVIFFVVFLIVITASGLSLLSMANLNQNMTEAAMSGQSNAILQMMQGMMGFFLLFFLVCLVVGAWVYYLYLKLNDNEIRNNNNSVFAALSGSFSAGIWSVLGYFLMFTVISIAVFLVFGVLAFIFMLMGSAGTVLVFIGYFFVIVFLLRFVLGLPAIVHGKMRVMEALNFSYRNITWKRAGFLFLGILVAYVLFFILSMLAIPLVGSSFISGNVPNIGSLVIFMLVFMLLCAALYAFAFSSLSALYFRYSTDPIEGEEGDLKEHLVS